MKNRTQFELSTLQSAITYLAQKSWEKQKNHREEFIKELTRLHPEGNAEYTVKNYLKKMLSSEHKWMIMEYARKVVFHSSFKYTGDIQSLIDELMESKISNIHESRSSVCTDQVTNLVTAIQSDVEVSMFIRGSTSCSLKSVISDECLRQEYKKLQESKQVTS